MRVRLRQLNEELLAEATNRAPSNGTIKMGVGINTGQCCVGNMGSEQGFNYSVLDDSANLAACFDEDTLSFGVDLFIGENTRRQVPDLEAYELGHITVGGRNQPVRVFTLPEDGSRDHGSPI